MATNSNWQCPYCGFWQVLTGDSMQDGEIRGYFVKNSEYGNVGLWATSIACLNSECKKLTLKVGLGDVKDTAFNTYVDKYFPREIWNLLPASMAKPQPDYIPEPIREDYNEACSIAKLSPKSAATLARRCLQAMIKDFCDISKNSLYLDIKELESQVKKHGAPQGVTMELISAIDGIRSMGNIGAHMKTKSNIVVDIEPDEADLLIQLIEMLFKEWYVARHDREERLQQITQIATAKKSQVKANTDESGKKTLPPDTSQK